MSFISSFSPNTRDKTRKGSQWDPKCCIKCIRRKRSYTSSLKNITWPLFLLFSPDITCSCFHDPIHWLLPSQYDVSKPLLDQRGRKGSEHRGKVRHQYETLSYFMYFLWIIRVISHKTTNYVKNLLLTYSILHGYSSSHLTEPLFPLNSTSASESLWNELPKCL